MAICMKCGKEVSLMGRECPYCHYPMNYKNLIDDSIKNTKDMENVGYDAKDNMLMYQSILIPLGLFNYLKNKNEYPLRASSALAGLLIGIIIILVLITLIMVIKLF